MTSHDPFKTYKLGDPEFKSRTGRQEGSLQDYEALKTQYAGKGWIDPDFPHNITSIGILGDDTANKRLGDTKHPVEWHRIKDMVQNKCFFYGKGDDVSYPGENTAKFACECTDDSNVYSRFDITQGSIGNCFFVASLATVAQHSRAIQQVVPMDNINDLDSGVYHFRFFYLGCWVEVVVDDYLPFYAVQQKTRTLYMTIGSKLMLNGSVFEYWVALTEKAYAKLAGNYGNISRGAWPMDSLQNLTGGLCERYQEPYQDFPEDFIDSLISGVGKTCLVGLTCAPRDPNKAQNCKKFGICVPHAYSITKAVKLQTNDGKTVQLVRVYNPHGKSTGDWDTEYRGSWCDHDKAWNTISESDKAKISFTCKDDGEFWMSLNDVKYFFDKIDVVSFLFQESITAPWVVEQYDADFGTGNDEYNITVSANPGQTIAVVAVEALIKSPIWSHLGRIYIDFDMYPASGGNPIKQAEGTKVTGQSDGHSMCLAYKVQPGSYKIIVHMVHGPVSQYGMTLYYRQAD